MPLTSRYAIHTHVGNVHAYVYSKVVEKLVGVSLSEVEYVLRDCAEKEGCVEIAELKRWRMWNTGC